VGVLIGKEAISEELEISLATVNNWIKTRVIPPPDIRNYYSKAAFDCIINKIKKDATRLNSGANRTLSGKRRVSCLGITDKNRRKLLDNLAADFEKSNLSVDDGVLALAFAVLRSNKLIDTDRQCNANSKIDALLSGWIKKSADPDIVKRLYFRYEIQNNNDDILGAFYQSIQSISQKSSSGSYYTPPALLKDITIPPCKTILDPCCGSGSVLLNVLTKNHNPSKIFARDIDETALKICFINLALFFNDANIEPNILKQDIISGNNAGLLPQDDNEQFDCIITNPPWGSKITKQQKEYIIKSFPELATTEIFSIALYNSLKKLKKNGELYFFLPHAFLNVAAHRNIRKYIFNKAGKIAIKLLGSAFKDVLSESILIHVKNDSAGKNIYIQNKEGNIYQFPPESISPPDYTVNAACKIQDALIMDKIYRTEHFVLREDAVFALGIVTGNNKRHLLRGQTEGSEAIFRGKDIEKYSFSKPEFFVEFQPGLYQQAAPIEYYRQTKIAYRFIGDRLVCALDKDNRLLLNSANLLISKKYPMETIVACLNSNIYTFLFRKRFHSRKVLKSHLQDLPLPILSDEIHQYIHTLYDKTIEGTNGGIALFQNEIDKIICGAFSIEQDQYDYIIGDTNGNT
jgi:type I restriction-modification system DNA methylase subunit